ncbi:MAG: hypothetical protein PHU03_04780 [Syntrophales bacterium]|nr:hypothetical protein [Syntrophales bacterium]
MPEAFKTILLIIFVAGALFLSLRIAAWKMKRAFDTIIRDLKSNKAFDPESAAELPYAKGKMINLGLRDYRPKALEELIKLDVVRMVEGGRYYLGDEQLTGFRGYKTQR